MPQGIRFTVIVPVYKVEPYLDECVRSILSQGHENLNLVLVDDGSPDRCPGMCDAWAERDARVRVVHKTNGGLASARNAGLPFMDGDYLLFVDSDDHILPGTLAGLAEACETKGRPDLVLFNSRNFGPGYVKPELHLDIPAGIVLDSEPAKKRFVYPLFLAGSSLNNVWRYTLATGIASRLRFDENQRYGEDLPYSLQAFSCAASILYLDRAYYMYRDNPDGLTGRCDPGRYRFMKNMNKALADQVRSWGFSGPETERMLALRILSSVHLVGKRLVMTCRPDTVRDTVSAIRAMLDDDYFRNRTRELDIPTLRPRERIWYRVQASTLLLPLVASLFALRNSIRAQYRSQR